MRTSVWFENPDDGDAREPHLLPSRGKPEAVERLVVRRAEIPIADGTLGDTGLGVEVEGPDRFDEAILVLPYDRGATTSSSG